MRSSDLKITRIERCFFEGEDSDALAVFDASVGDFNIRRGILRQGHDGGFYVGLGGGRRRACVTLPRESETREALVEATVQAYKEILHESW